jgi:hypothetical protein
MTMLVTRESTALVGRAAAVFSDDFTYRYLLTRSWGDGPFVTWVMLNPSIADEMVNDPTVTRCINFSRGWGAGGLTVVNLYGLRSTDPSVLAVHPDPVGPDNDRIIGEHCALSTLVVCAWGAGAKDPERVEEVRRILGGGLACLGITKGGHPRHPLYVHGATRLMPYPEVARD